MGSFGIHIRNIGINNKITQQLKSIYFLRRMVLKKLHFAQYTNFFKCTKLHPIKFKELFWDK